MPRDGKLDDERNGDDEGPSNWVNLGAFLLLAVIVVGGLWLMDELLRVSKQEDCAMSGRRNCVAPLVTPSTNR